MTWSKIISDEKLIIEIEKKIEELRKILKKKNNHQIDGALIQNTGGLVLFDYYYCKLKNRTDKGYQNDLIKSLFEKVNTTKVINYATGFVGLMFLLANLERSKFIKLDPAFFDLPETMFDSLKNSMYIDYLHGSGGLALFLAEYDLKISKNILKDWCENLSAQAIQETQTAAWKVKVNEHGEQAFCLGLAHGVPGIILILIKILKKHEIPIASELLQKAINFLLKCKNKNLDDGYFPYNIFDHGASSHKRLSWCYGDLGCALALYKAGLYFKDENYISLSLEIFDFHARNKEQALEFCFDPGFCHGSVGIAHFYARMYNCTGRESFRLTSEYWYKITISKSHYTDGLAGFKNYNGTTQNLECSATILEGVTGVGLSFISAIANIEPEWDNIFLLS